MWEESSLPNMAVPTGGREESSLRKPDQGTRVSFRGRGRRGIRGGGGKGQRGWGAMATGTIRRRVVTRSRTAILLKCNAEEAANREMMDFTSELEKANISASLSPPPPAKKQKQTPPGLEDPPGASGESKAECSSRNNGGVTIMDISASSRANAVCGASDDVALSGAGPANNVCGEPRDSSTASPLFSTASVNSNDGSSKYTPILAINPSREESIAFQTPPLQSHTTTNATTTTTITATGEAGCIGAAEGDGCTGMVSSSGKPCKSSSPSPPFAQCSSSSATGTTSRPQPGQPSMQLVCLYVCIGISVNKPRLFVYGHCPFWSCNKGQGFVPCVFGYQGLGDPSLPPLPPHTYPHTHTHTHVHTHTHTRTRHIYICIHIRTHLHTHADSYPGGSTVWHVPTADPRKEEKRHL